MQRLGRSNAQGANMMKKRIPIAGAILVTMLVLSGLGASAASASHCYLVSNFMNLKKGGNFSTINSGTEQCETEVVKLTGRWVLVESLVGKTVEDLYCAKLLLSAGREPEKETGYYKNQFPEKCETVLAAGEENKSNYTEVIVPGGAEATKILPEPTEKEPLTATVTQRAQGHLLTVGGLEVKCEKGNGSESWTAANSGTVEILFTECKGPLSTICTTEGDPEGLVSAKGEVRFWLGLLMTGTKEKETTELIGALVFLLESSGVKFTCVNKTKTIKDEIVVKGCTAAQVLPASLNALIKEAKEEFAEWTSGEAKILKILPQEAKEEISCLPTASTNGGAEELSALTSVFVAEKYKKGGKEITIELMNP